MGTGSFGVVFQEYIITYLFINRDLTCCLPFPSLIFLPNLVQNNMASAWSIYNYLGSDHVGFLGVGFCRQNGAVLLDGLDFPNVNTIMNPEESGKMLAF